MLNQGNYRLYQSEFMYRALSLLFDYLKREEKDTKGI